MVDPVELRKLVKQLQNAPTPTDIVGVLNILKSQHNITEAILRETKAGLAVGKLRTHSSQEVSDLAKVIVKNWKQAVEKEKQANGGASPKTLNGKPLDRKTSMNNASTPTTPTATSVLVKQENRNSKSDGVKGGTGDSTRDKCIELIYDGLATNSSAPVELVLSRARGIEKCVLNDNGGTTAGYKSKIRSLFVNLKDKNNPTLSEKVVSGDIPVERFTRMSSSEMASAERKAADKKIIEENLYKSLGAEEQQAETDAFQCSRCKQRKCRYRQAQTRSADEPMTTFVTCVNCGNRWKFS